MNEQYTAPAPNDDLMEALHEVEPDEYGRTFATGEQRERIQAILDQLGLTTEGQVEESIERGIADARWLVETSEAVQTLKDHPFRNEHESKRFLAGDLPTATIDFPADDPVTIAWNKLDWAITFDSWLGRGRHGSGEVDSAPSSLHKVFDFATRETKLPPIQLLLILTSNGPVTVALNSHRAAAAILRNEDVGCNYLKVIDARSAA